MGRNSQQRKANRRRAAPSGSGPRSGDFGSAFKAGHGEPGLGGERRGADGPDALERARAAIRAGAFRLGADGADSRAAVAEAVLATAQPVSSTVVADAAEEELVTLVTDVVDGGWGPADLVELVTRGGGSGGEAGEVSVLLTALHAECRANSARGAAWQQVLTTHGADPRVRADTVRGLASALVVMTLLVTAPLLRSGDLEGLAGEAVTASGSHPKLARVRALLAKAESTTFPEEAEALSAKAQELIARYSLEQKLAAAQSDRAGVAPRCRRIWLDAPYQRAKSSLVHAVATANHCRTAWSSRHGFCIVVGVHHDLDAVELLVTSLLVQADRAMLAHGSRSDWLGTSRTRSFRQAFLEAYASRVGERLREAGEAMVAHDADALVPVLYDHDEQVRRAFEELVPHTTSRSRSVGNHEGWIAGTAAGDQAQLGVRGRIAADAG